MNQRIFNLGSEWLYVKIYSGPQTLEKVLLNPVANIFEILYSEGIIDKFFFIRYIDDFHHLRIRIKLVDITLLSRALEVINDQLRLYINNKLIWNILYASYNRELERYGNDNIDDCETLFCYSSWSIICLLRQMNEQTTEDKRWLLGARSVNSMLTEFGLLLPEKSWLLESLVRAYGNEYNLTKTALINLNDKYRRISADMETAITPTEVEIISGMLPKLAEVKFTAIQNIASRYKIGTTDPMLPELLQSLIHMHLNRLFRTRQRKNEFVLCYMMDKGYRSKIARNKLHHIIK